MLYRIRRTHLESEDGVESSINLDGQSRQEREFIVDSAASMHTMNKTGLSPAELETVKVSPLPTTVITATGSIDTTEEGSLRERFGHARHCPTSRRHFSIKIRGKTLRIKCVFK